MRLETATMNVSIPGPLRDFIDAQVESGEYQSASEYIRDLVRREKYELDRLLLEGLRSGPPAILDMKAVRRKAAARLKANTTRR
jgi:antitoxin ParD1/3/4